MGVILPDLKSKEAYLKQQAQKAMKASKVAETQGDELEAARQADVAKRATEAAFDAKQQMDSTADK